MANVVALMFLLGGAVQADEAPLVGRPENYSGAIGLFRMTSSAVPTAVHIEEPVTLTVRISSPGLPPVPPMREKLRLFPAGIEKDYYLEPLPDQDRVDPDAHTWDFAWRLRPKHEKVTAIPSLRFVYFLPGLNKYQTTFAPAIPIEVKPRELAVAPKTLKREDIPRTFYEIIPAAELLHRPWYEDIPAPIAWGVGSFGPPLVCAVWYYLWRRNNRDAWQRRKLSRAGREALAALRSAPVESLGSIMASYLQTRWRIPAAEPTPAEVERHLTRRGVRRNLTQRVAAWLQARDAARFAPAPPSRSDEPTHEAAWLVQYLEAEPCRASR